MVHKKNSPPRPLERFKIIATNDGSHTLYSHHYGEACHSLAGALAETNYNYIEGCELPRRINDFEIFNIFEMGFGIGIGPYCTLNFLNSIHSTSPLHFYSVEQDEKLITWALKEGVLKEINFREEQPVNLKKMIIRKLTCKNFKLSILVGDIKKNFDILKSILPGIHAIYQDPFSPKKNPECWTANYFTFLKEISHQKVLLSTYSSSQSIRKSMLQAGWHFKNRKGFGKKRLATIATLAASTSLPI